MSGTFRISSLLLLVLLSVRDAQSFPLSSLSLEHAANAAIAPYLPKNNKNLRKLASRRVQPAAAERRLEFGDYAAYPDTCPLVTSCQVVCVANETDCPTTCPEGTQLCGESGICLEDCDTLPEQVENPCYCETLAFACAKPVDVWENCFERFQDFYDVSQECIDAQEEALPTVDFHGPWFLACYIILSTVTGLTMLFCAFNTYSPVPGSTTIVKYEEENEDWTMTGYKSNPIGLLLFYLVYAVLWGFQFVLFVLTIFYYMQQEAITRWAPVFYDEVEVLKAFQITWMVGICWSFAFYYPTSIRELFLLKCKLSEATDVAVEAPMRRVETPDDVSGWGELSMAALWWPFDTILRLVFSYPHGKLGFETVYCKMETDAVTGTKGFYCRMRRFVYDGEKSSFTPGRVHVGKTLGDFLDQVDGLTTSEANLRYGVTGPNIIPMKKPTILGSILAEFSKPFYLYQNYMVWTWFPYWYYYMGIVNTCVRVTAGIVVGIFQYQGDSVLYQLSYSEGHSTVIRDGKQVEIANEDIVPGDVMVLKPGVVSCDMSILKAGRLVVDESALTGEAHPVVKSAIDPTMSKATYDPLRHKTCMLSAGTEILEIDEGGTDLGLVMASGSFTSKGKLVTEVLSYKRHKFKFDDEVLLVLCILVVQTFVYVGMVFSFIDLSQWVYAWFYASFVIGTIIPPLLPTVFVVSVGISAKRLNAKRIACTYQEGILVAGKVNAAFFDKTGTLTKQTLDFHSLDAASPELKEKAVIAMAVCHTLHKTRDGHLIGNSVEVASFEYTGADIVQKDGAASEITLHGQTYSIVKKYEFDNHRVTQSVIVKDGSGKHMIFVKGSPESIRELCTSGVPTNFDQALEKSSKSGVYLLAIASKDYNPDTDINIADISRDDVETNLQFDAFLGFQNALRESTPAVIQEVLAGDVSCTMITGDNVFTGICVAKVAGMIQEGRGVFLGIKTSDGEIYWSDIDNDSAVAKPTPEMLSAPSNNVDLAMTGEAWSTMLEDDPKYATSIAKYIRVFGRCNPADKVSVVTHFVQQGRKTLMCGDGGNDCGGLKAAHVGIALSTAEASVVAPFTSLDKDIASVTEVLREGRCALASAFAAYSYYIIFGQVESYLQVIHAYFGTTFSEWCWVFMDGIWSTLLAFSLPLSKAAPKLSPKRPTSSLIGPRTMASVCGLLALNFVFLVIALAVLFNQDWFQCRQWKTDDVSDVRSIGDNYETTLLFLVGGFQYICSAISLNFGYTWRENFWKNYLFVLLAGVFTIMQFVATFYPSSFSCIWRVNCGNENVVRSVTKNYPVAIGNPWNTTLLPVEFRWKLFGIMICNLAAVCIWQYFIVNGVLDSMLSKKKTAVKREDAATMDEVAPKSVVRVEDSLTDGLSKSG